MPEPAFPQLRSLSLAAQGQPLHLRVLLPPNFASLVARSATIPLKIEFCPSHTPLDNTAAQSTPDKPHPQATPRAPEPLQATPLPPERLPQRSWSLEPGVFLAALLIESWCNGRIPSMLQLNVAQLSQLLQPLEGIDCVFWLKAPQQPVRWDGGQLPGVHQHLRDQQAAGFTPTDKDRAPLAAAAHDDNPFAPEGAPQPAAHLPAMEAHLTALEVDGSPNFLALRLPSRESALYPHALALVKDNGFQLEPSNGKWWLRNRHKTLQFLADHLHDLRTAYRARFTENFTERTAQMRFVRMALDVRSTTPRGNDAFDLELYFSAPDINEAALQQALEKGQHYIEVPAGQQPTARKQTAQQRNTTSGSANAEYRKNAAAASTGAGDSLLILVPRSVREQAQQVQQALGAAPAQGLRSRFRSRIRKEEVAATQAILQSLKIIPSADNASMQAATDHSAADATQPEAAHAGSKTRTGSRTSADRTAGDKTADTPFGKRVINRQRTASQRGQSPAHAQTEEADDILPAAKLPAQWLSLSRALNDLRSLAPCPCPPPLWASLRPYQQVGAAWLWHLYRSGLGGILADEMGLGKTVQCLSFLAAAGSHSSGANRQDLGTGHNQEARHGSQPPATGSQDFGTNPSPMQFIQAGQQPAPHAQFVQAGQQSARPSLVVCPAALVENWRREAKKFTPHLRVFCHHGDSRLADASEAATYDLILTSYGTLVRDQQLFETIDFLVAVGDEAQHIKNAKTQNAKAMRALRAHGRFLLTGTPVENDIRELQSLFTFILPGYLKPPPRTTGGGAMPASITHDNERSWLIARAAPYILRRMKRAVAADLPEKIEQTIYCELDASQRAFYRQTQEDARRAVQQLELGGAAENRIRFAAFTELLRLRQVCIDPQLVDAQRSDIGSAKREALLELVQEAADGDHRMLIFSQFTSALKLVAEDLDAMGLRHFYLDGQTPNRAALCERFNEDDSVKAFLISLRAGGTGLNLTGADTVIHLDPWWNPAAQAQATDRAHRIGQQKVVTVYQLIAAQTVEEQVLTLQREKAALLEQLLDASDNASARIALDDLKSLIG